MIECLILGDSIAKGVASVRSECDTYAKKGITSEEFNKKWNQRFDAPVVVVSLGTNDTHNTKENLELLRSRISARNVYWLIPPLNEEARKTVIEVAQKYYDVTIDVKKFKRADDKIHPTKNGYKEIAHIALPR